MPVSWVFLIFAFVCWSHDEEIWWWFLLLWWLSR